MRIGAYRLVQYPNGKWALRCSRTGVQRPCASKLSGIALALELERRFQVQKTLKEKAA